MEFEESVKTTSFLLSQSQLRIHEVVITQENFCPYYYGRVVQLT